MATNKQFKMVGTYLRPDQVEKMIAKAGMERRPQAELYRDAVDLYLTQPAPADEPSTTTGEQPE